MMWQIEWPAAELIPTRDTLCRAMGLPNGVRPSAATSGLLDQAQALFLELAAPRAVFRDIDVPTFARVFAGAHRNDERTPVADIYPRAEALALYVATLGTPVADAIGELFATNEPALGYALDTLASESSALLSSVAGEEVGTRCSSGCLTRPDSHSLSYSPGHCGWDVSGQHALFEFVRPDRSIGVTLNDSSLMQPMKSVSGVVIVAPLDAHATVLDYDCCRACSTRHCTHRLTARRNA